MVCKNCGRYNPDEKVECVYCGNSLEKNEVTGLWLCAHCGAKNTKESTTCVACSKEKKQRAEGTKMTGDSRWFLGFLLGLLINFFALFVGFFKFKKDTFERKSFMTGWLRGVLILFAVSLVVFVFTYVSISVCTLYD